MFVFFSVGLKLRSLFILRQHRQKVFENRVPRKIFGGEEDISGAWRKMHN
jgi:hypothetical protein